MKGMLFVKPADIAVFLAALALTIFSAWELYANPKGAPQIRIRGSGGEWIFPLDAEETVRVTGPLGTTVIQIHDRAARVESSPCANQSCVAAGPVNRHGSWTACLPNNVFLMVENYPGGTYDESETDENRVDTIAW